MEELLEKIALCVEFGKINQKTPYPPNMKGELGVDELTLQALEEGVAPAKVLQEGLILGMERIGIKFKENKMLLGERF